ncbi:hypothetical protein EPN52_07500 [bacterium]|nr:MAG: hypothetical protein EPN52_07500 [bacterium]
MPIEPRLFIKTAMVYLGLTFLAGVILAAAEAFQHPLPPIIAIEHGHAGFVGWLVNVVIGVALWMFPLDTRRFPESKGRYPVRAVIVAYLALNVGLPLRLIFEPWVALADNPAVSALLIFGALLQFAAIAIVGFVVWVRIKAPARAPARTR